MKTRFLWMILKISLPSGRHREGPKINHFDKIFSPSKGSHRETPKIAGWMIFFCPSRGRARKIGFYALFSKIICFRLKIGVSYQLLKERGSKLAQIFVCGIKIDAIFGSGISAVALKLMPFLITSSLIPSGKGHFLSSFQKNIRSLNPRLEVVLSTYPARISPIIPYSNFCGWKTTRFMKKFPTPLYRNFRSQKTKHFPNLFQKNVLTPLPHVFEPKTEALLQKTFSTIYHTFSGKKRTRFSKKVSYSYTACFFRRI